MDQIRPIGRPDHGSAPIPAIGRLTPEEREEAARERGQRRQARARAAGHAPGDEPPEGSASLDIRA